MKNWEILSSPGELPCSQCELLVDPGYFVARHPLWPSSWVCLSCCLADVRRFHRECDLRSAAAGQ